METKKFTTKDYFRSLTIIYYALVVGAVTFTIIAFLLQEFLFDKTEMEILIYLVPLFILGAIFGGNALFKKRLNEAISKTELKEKLSYYQSALIIKYALLEGAVYFAIVSYLITGDLLFLGLSILTILVFLINIPSISKAENELELNQNEKLKINDPETILGDIRIQE